MSFREKKNIMKNIVLLLFFFLFAGCVGKIYKNVKKYRVSDDTEYTLNDISNTCNRIRLYIEKLEKIKKKNKRY